MITHRAAAAPPHRILVGLDGSAHAERILGVVRSLAARLKAEVVLLHVAQAPDPVRPPASSGPAAPEGRAGSEHGSLRAYLDRIARSLADAGISVQAETVEGEVAPSIVRYVERERIDLVALTTHCRSGVRHWILGSVTNAVLGTTTTPVLLLHAPAETAPFFDVQQIMVALDGSTLAETALAPAERLASALGVDLVLVFVVASSTLDFRQLFGQREDAARYLALRATELRARGATVQTSVIVGMAAEAIAAEARARGGTLLALTTHARTGWRAVAFGSVTQRAIELVELPVLVIRPHEPSPDAS